MSDPSSERKARGCPKSFIRGTTDFLFSYSGANVAPEDGMPRHKRPTGAGGQSAPRTASMTAWALN
ncbi:hypothetical protein, partial [Enterobacter hormaechei]|uniref:hypothetical protein n=1 Tax=Enterobacter hormaechei TaxID=158836 RepID=UPI001953AD5E